MNLNQFQASNAALNFAANAKMISSYTTMELLYLKNLTDTKDAHGNVIEKGILSLTGDMAVQDQRAIISSGDNERDAQLAQGWAQIAGGIASAGTAFVGYRMAKNVENTSDEVNSPEQLGRANMVAEENPAAASLPEREAAVELSDIAPRSAVKADSADMELGVQDKASTVKEDNAQDKAVLEKGKKDKEEAAANAYRKANSLRDTSFQLGSMLTNLANGIGGVVASDYTYKKAEADAARTGLDNAIQQLGNTYNLMIALVQQMAQSAQATKDAQGAIVAVTKS
jgi:hypothetical protein